MPPTFPVSTVTDAFGSFIFSPAFQSMSLRFAGPSGSAWLVGPDECHTYSAAPNFTIFTCRKSVRHFFSAVLEGNFHLCALLGSLFTISRDHSPSGLFTA